MFILFIHKRVAVLTILPTRILQFSHLNSMNDQDFEGIGKNQVYVGFSKKYAIFEVQKFQFSKSGAHM